MKESQVQRLIYDSFEGRLDVRAVVPNIYFFDRQFECDCLIIQDSGYTIEMEIKVSKWDYLHDFKKKDKHDRMKNALDIETLPNQFYFVCPKGMIEPKEVKDLGYCGLFDIIDAGMGKRFIRKVVEAPMIHKERLSPHKYEELAFKLAGRLW